MFGLFFILLSIAIIIFAFVVGVIGFIKATNDCFNDDLK